MNKTKVLKEESKRFALIIVSSLVYSLAVNLFLVPAGVYCGGLFGLCQVIRTLLTDKLGMDFGFDIASLIYYVINIPILLYAWFKISRGFLLRTLLCLTVMTAALSLIPIRSLLPDDKLASCVIGGIIAGAGAGLYLRMGASGGGFDVVGLVLVRHNMSSSIGKINLFVNAALFLCCGFLFSIEVVIYSMIFTAIYSVVVDRVHIQNVNVEVKIITSATSDDMEKAIMNELGRGVTRIHSTGAYTRQDSWMVYVTLSKYELPYLRSIIHRYDPNAFIVVNENVRVFGNYLKKL